MDAAYLHKRSTTPRLLHASPRREALLSPTCEAYFSYPLVIDVPMVERFFRATMPATRDNIRPYRAGPENGRRRPKPRNLPRTQPGGAAWCRNFCYPSRRPDLEHTRPLTSALLPPRHVLVRSDPERRILQRAGIFGTLLLIPSPRVSQNFWAKPGSSSGRCPPANYPASHSHPC